MIILALETTGNTCGAAVASCVEGQFVLKGLAEIHEENVHDERLASLVQQVLAATDLRITDVDLVAVSGGPGSFTGTRIGVSFAKGLTLFGQPALAVIDTCESLAQAAVEVARAAGRSRIAVAIPSHRALYYVDHFDVVDALITRPHGHTAPRLLPISEIDVTDALVCGPGARDVDPAAVSGLTRLSARFVALRACMLLRAGTLVPDDPHTAEPLYRQEFTGRT